MDYAECELTIICHLFIYTKRAIKILKAALSHTAEIESLTETKHVYSNILLTFGECDTMAQLLPHKEYTCSVSVDDLASVVCDNAA